VAQGEDFSAMAVECKKIAYQKLWHGPFLNENHLQKLSGQWQMTDDR
jgi:hypothetical protein